MSNFVPIRLSTLRAEVQVKFNVFIKLADRYLLYVREGDGFAQDRLSSLKSKKVRQLFITDTDEVKYQAFLDDAILKASSDKNMKSSEKADIAEGQASAAVDDMIKNPKDIAVYKKVEKAAKGIVDIVAKNPNVLASVLKRELISTDEEDILMKHAVNVSSLSSTLAKLVGYSDKDLSDLGTAGLLLDLGRISLPEGTQKLFTKPYKDFSQEDWTVYKQHPEKSVDLLQGREYINKNILELVYTHEERKSGNGYPQGIRKLSLKQEIMGLCSCFDRYVTCLHLSHQEAFKEIQIAEAGNFDLALVKKLQELLKKESILA